LPGSGAVTYGAVMGGDGSDRRRLALVTGASSGIGETFARRLARDGYDLVVVARRRPLLVSLARDLQQCGAHVDIVEADLADAGSLRAVEMLLSDLAHLDLLVNNAGSALPRFTATDPDDLEAMIRLNTVAPTRLARASVPGMVARGGGAIVNVASVAAFQPRQSPAALPFSTYGATKAYLVALSLRLHQELTGSGIRVQALCPGYVTTNANQAKAYAGIIPPSAYMSPEDVVHASLVALERDEPLCVPALENADVLTLLDRVHDTISHQGGLKGTLATRYRPPPE
jgi:short-subunit dehydrogenase